LGGLLRVLRLHQVQAQPAFAAVGFKVMQHEEVQIRGEVFKRALMAKGAD